MAQIKWWKFQKGMGIRVKIAGDIDIDTGNQNIVPLLLLNLIQVM